MGCGGGGGGGGLHMYWGKKGQILRKSDFRGEENGAVVQISCNPLVPGLLSVRSEGKHP